MEKFITCSGMPVRVATYGNRSDNGSAALLLHGYLESLEVWGNFAEQLGRHVYTVALDLPGHGLSDTHPEVNSMELMADVAAEACAQLSAGRVAAIGHSMGGYVALALAKKYPALVSSLCLLHSTPNADTEEKKLQRDHEIALIAEGKKETLAQQSISMLFAADNASRLYEPIADIETCALIADDTGTIASLRGMKEREDMNEFLKTFGKPLLFVFGKKDRHISWEAASATVERFPQAQLLALENSGHAGFIEEEEIVLATIKSFALKKSKSPTLTDA
ncbi:MAG: alpha/beta hydrolase [Prevotellaceae bacterium]|jgi:pimeloyl-ACP methyl ester carboxylesterase|nr:alpha/beta hydrolase [Prevotellaceae bacterium]